MSVDRLRASFLAGVAAELERSAGDARRGREQRVADARLEADGLISEARRAGECDGGRRAASIRAQGQRVLRERELTARRDVYDRARVEAVEAVAALRAAEGYPSLLERLTAAARARLGEDAVVEVDPERGGVIARAGVRLVDLTLPALADRCLEGMGVRLRELWRE